MRTDKKREKEKKTLDFMISLYEKRKHIDCSELKAYAYQRIDKCPFMEEKTFCSSCKVHCYQKQYRDQMKQIMRFSGPRMLFYHPVMAVSHMVNTMKSKNI